MNRRTPLWFALGITLVGLLLPIVPRLVVPAIRPFPYDDPYVGAGIVGIGPVLAWNLEPFLLLALMTYFWLRKASLSARQRMIVLGGVLGALVPGIVVGLQVHTPNPTIVGFNFGAAFFPLYMLVLMPLGFAGGALLGWLLAARTRSPRQHTHRR